MKCNLEGVRLVKEFEGLSLTPYRCPAGEMTVGHGHVVLEPDEHGLMGGITEAQAGQLLAADLAKAARAVEKYTDVALNSNQESALISLVFNIGPANYAGSTLRQLVNQKRFDEAAGQFDRWVYATAGGIKKTLPGLVRRRKAEAALFKKPDLSGHDV